MKFITYERCPVCGLSIGQLKRHLKEAHGWRYTKESPDFPVAPSTTDIGKEK